MDTLPSTSQITSSSSAESVTKREHPLLLTLSEAYDIDQHLSDHIPLYFETNKELGVDMLSFNSLGRGADASDSSGLKDPKRQLIETPAQANARYKRLANGLVKTINSHEKLGILCFQEINIIDKLYLTLELKKIGWEPASTQNEDGTIKNDEVLTLYNPNLLTLQGKSILESSLFGRAVKSTFLSTTTKKTLTLYNVWGFFSPVQLGIEDWLRTLLTTNSNDSDIVATIGDFNARMLPTLEPEESVNLTTGLIPPRFNFRYNKPTDIVLPENTDGGFIFLRECSEIRQLSYHAVDLTTAAFADDPRSLEELGPCQRGVQMGLCLATKYQTIPIINGQSIAAYERFLRETLQTQNIYVRMSSDTRSQQYLCIGLPRNFPLTSLSEYEKNHSFTTQLLEDEIGGLAPLRFIYAPLSKIAELHQFIDGELPTLISLIAAAAEEKQRNKNPQYSTQIFTAIDRFLHPHIANLEKSRKGNLFFTSSVNKINALNYLKEQMRTIQSGSFQDFLTCVESWEQATESADAPSGEISLQNALNYSTMINTHRQRFPSFRQRETSTRAIINRLKEYLRSEAKAQAKPTSSSSSTLNN